jgi:DnaJ family protein A protein 2
MSMMYIKMEEEKDLYGVLDVSKDATSEEIKKAFRKLSMKHHPDRGGETGKFQAINEAYETLSDSHKKRMYDAGPSMHMFSGGQAEELFSFLNMNMFGGGREGGAFFQMGGDGRPMNFQQSLQRPTPIIQSVEISLEEAYRGKTQPLEVTRWIIEQGERREEKETLYLTIPKGIDDNEIIILRQKGNVISDSNKGDVKVFIKVVNRTEFEREGLDLIYNKTISLKEALCGFSFDLTYIDGRTFKINNGNGNVIAANYRKVIPSMGIARDENRGNLIINFDVVFPEKLHDEQVKSLQEIL